MSEKFWDDLNQFKNRYQQMFDDVCQSFALNPAEANIILYLAKNKKDTATDIVKYTGYSKSNVSTAVRKLELGDYLRMNYDNGTYFESSKLSTFKKLTAFYDFLKYKQ